MGMFDGREPWRAPLIGPEMLEVNHLYFLSSRFYLIASPSFMAPVRYPCKSRVM